MERKYLIPALFLALSFCLPNFVSAYTDCSQYGVMAYDAGGGYCKCMSGYVFDSSYGTQQCKNADFICTDKYGFGAEYDVLSNSCECRYGYVLGKDSLGRTQCITENDACQNQLGYNSRSTYGGQCECSYGYIIQGGQCVYANTYCSSKYGIHSSYDSLDKVCECDSGYTLGDDGQCREKQNNVYFRLLDVDTDNRQAIIKSEYDYRQYLVEYGTGCYSFSFNRYVNKQIVVNLGTDFEVDRWDRIVLQDDDEICDIRSEERTYYDSFEEMNEDGSETYSSNNYYIPPQNSAPSTNVFTATPSQNAIPSKPKAVDFEVSDSEIQSVSQAGVLKSSASFRKCPSTECSIIRYYAEGSELNLIGQYLKGDWYQVKGTTDAGGTGVEIIGWIHKSLIDIKQSLKSEVVTESGKTSEKKEPSWVKVWNGFLSWFKKK